MQQKLKLVIKDKRIFLGILIILVSITGIFLLTRKPYIPTEPDIKGPDAPITQDAIIEEITNETTTLTINKLENVIKVEQSYDSNHFFIITKENNIYKLLLANSATEVIKTIEDQDIINAKFVDNSTIVYGLGGKIPGVYRYSIPTDVRTQLVNSSDPEAIKSITSIDDSKVFFVEPRTGRIGFIFINEDRELILDTKRLETDSTYVMAGAYSLIGVSPDRKYIALVDKTEQKDTSQGALLIIIPSTATSMKDVIYKQSTSINPGQAIEDVAHWSPDSRYLIVGDNALMIELSKGETLYNGDPSFIIRPSLDFGSIFFCDKEYRCFVKNIGSKETKEVTKYISDAIWIDADRLVFIVGKRLYLYHLNESRLELITSEESNYKLVGSSKLTENIIIIKNNKLVNIKFK